MFEVPVYTKFKNFLHYRRLACESVVILDVKPKKNKIKNTVVTNDQILTLILEPMNCQSCVL